MKVSLICRKRSFPLKFFLWGILLTVSNRIFKFCTTVIRHVIGPRPDYVVNYGNVKKKMYEHVRHGESRLKKKQQSENQKVARKKKKYWSLLVTEINIINIDLWIFFRPPYIFPFLFSINH